MAVFAKRIFLALVLLSLICMITMDPTLNSGLRDANGNLKPGIDKRRGRSAVEYGIVEELFNQIRSIAAQILDINIPEDDDYEWSGLTEGDTVFGAGQMRQVLNQLRNELEEKLGTTVDAAADAVGGLANVGKRKKRNAIGSRRKKWSAPRSKIPYTMKITEADTIALIKESLAGWEEKTCIKFEETTTPTRNWLEFIKDEGCWSYVGKQRRGKQPVSIGEGCETLGIVSHEIGHSLGFYHEQGRTDRDDFVDIVPENIETGNEANFNKYDDALTLGIPYDEDSVLHYDGWAFSKNRESYPRFTIMAKNKMMQERYGQREGLSFYDIKIANLRYCSRSCGGTDLESADCQYGGYKNPNECTKCNCPEGFGGKFCEILTAGVGTNLGEKKSVSCSEMGKIAMEFPKAAGIVKTFWLLEAPPDKTITVTITKADTNAEDTEQFCTDYLEVKHQDVIRAGPRFCKGHPQDFPLPVSLKSQKNLILLKARLESGKGASFDVQYKVSDC